MGAFPIFALLSPTRACGPHPMAALMTGLQHHLIHVGPFYTHGRGP
jgi:hypothetical protein